MFMFRYLIMFFFPFVSCINQETNVANFSTFEEKSSKIPLELLNDTTITSLQITGQICEGEETEDCFYFTEIPKEIGKMKNLKELKIVNSNIDVLPNEINKLKKLKKLCFYESGVTDIGNIKLDSLEELEIVEFRLIKIPKTLCSCKSLKKISFNLSMDTLEVNELRKCLPDCEFKCFSQTITTEASGVF